MSEKANYIEVLSKLDEFPWGTPIQVHTIGDFVILEFEDKDDDHIRFISYVRDNNNYLGGGHTIHDTLDRALVHALSIKYQDADVGYYIARMLKMEGAT